MKCLRCGYCCVESCVVIVDDPAKGIITSNLIAKDSGVGCKHLTFRGKTAVCKLHNYKWYKETPCFKHKQIEMQNSNCRIGEYMLKNTTLRRKIWAK